jgi:hypothetical protein
MSQPEDHTLRTNYCENLKSHMMKLLSLPTYKWYVLYSN